MKYRHTDWNLLESVHAKCRNAVVDKNRMVYRYSQFARRWIHSSKGRLESRMNGIMESIICNKKIPLALRWRTVGIGMSFSFEI